jgi:UDP-glucuronate 4-epimerase
MTSPRKPGWNLVTGGAGFIGSHLVEALLKRGEKIIILDNFNDYYSPALKERNIAALQELAGEKTLNVIQGDIRDAQLLDRVFSDHEITRVYHLAAMAGVRYSLQHPPLYFEVNVEGTVNLLEAIRSHGKPGLVFASSSSVYGGSKTIPFTESDPVNKPVSPYAASKKAGELACHTYHHIYDLDITCLRFFTVYGPRQRPEMAIHLFTRKIVGGEAIPMFGAGDTSRDYTYIDDIVSGIISAGDRNKGYSIYNLGNNQTVKLAELIDVIGETTGITPVIDQLPIPPGDVLRTWADISLAQKHLGYQPKTDIRTGVARFYEWFRKVNEV